MQSTAQAKCDLLCKTKLQHKIGLIEAPVAVYGFELAQKLLRLGESLLGLGEPLKYKYYLYAVFCSK